MSHRKSEWAPLLRRSFVGCAVAVASLGLPVLASAARTDDHVESLPGVVEVADDGVCSLSEAMLSVNAGRDVTGGECPGTAEVGEFDLGGRTYTIRGRYDAVVAPSPPPAGSAFATAYFPIATTASGHGGRTALPVVTRPMTIQNGAIERAADAPPLRLLEVAPGGSLTLHEVALRGGDPRGPLDRQDGGAILSEQATLTLDRCVVSGNAATSGGAIVVNGGTTSLVRTWFVNNRARWGDGGALVVGDHGGRHAVLAIDGGGFAANRSDGAGGALVVRGDVASTFTDVTIEDNHAGELVAQSSLRAAPSRRTRASSSRAAAWPTTDPKPRAAA